ncbi:MAG: MBL fold metallo-hydrolase [Bacteroidales bacterium]|nr:MBL fold metallo-hydrolase [Porphyromonas sp.]MDD6934231.1 MBL fold metallo-hydrolase [Bacteroidales bacterium]MDY3102287.1 MBL fold metallo-hydrolase [Porphyromonas sp.]
MAIEVHTFSFNFVQVNTYLLIDQTTRQAAIIDCGCMMPAEEQLFVEQVEQLDAHPTLLLATHLHFDHVWGVPFAAEKWRLTPQAHRVEIEKMPSFNQQMQAFGMPSTPDRRDLSYHPFETGTRFTLGDTYLEALFVPGHTPGHVAFYEPRQGLLFSGDVLFAGGDIGRTDLPGGSYTTLVDSIKTQLMPLNDETIVYSGHGPQSTIGFERGANHYIK